ncbi:MAG: hypothetical protein EOM13_01880, partial [Clostridia bacterium]|nr:hypothetical protein [Clostridia bacterium]
MSSWRSRWVVVSSESTPLVYLFCCLDKLTDIGFGQVENLIGPKSRSAMVRPLNPVKLNGLPAIFQLVIEQNTLAKGNRPILFVSDYNLGHYAAKKTGRKIILWNGCCPTHALLSTFAVAAARKKWPEAQVIMHPECKPETLELADFVGSTSGMLKFVKAQSAGTSFIVGTEVGLLHR